MADESSVCRVPGKYRVGNLRNLYYIPDFISMSEEEHLRQVLKTSKAAWNDVSLSSSADNLHLHQL